MAVGGNFTNCNCGPGAETCQSPTQPVATVGLCLADGTPIAVTVVRDCAGNVTAEGWINLGTSVFTPGPPPADVGSCDTRCADTLCVQRCDDTDGDGAADETYSELWCVRLDGSTQLLLTYQGDPSQTYTPVSPIECTYGCTDEETVTLCDDTGPFLRRYTWLNGTASYEDVNLDGQTPHTVTGTVRSCTGDGSGGNEPCEEQTTPAATVGLCLADGTPIAVVVTRDCTGTVTQDGWINLTTGAYSAGAPPVGAMACGDSRAFELAGLLCDVDPATGDVLGLVLVEYEYNADGSLASVRLVDPATGATYTLQGELRHCPAGTEEQPDQDLTVLCDVQADGTVTAFVRDYRRDPASGQISGHTDYTLDGAPYTPAGTVGVCAGEPAQCRDTSTVLLCDTTTTATPVTPTVTDATASDVGLSSPFVALAGSYAPLWSGGALTFPADPNASAGDGNQIYRVAVGRITAAPEDCEGAEGTLTVSMRVTQNGPGAGAGYVGRMSIHRGATGLVGQGVTAGAPPGFQQTLTATASVTAEDLASGDLYVVLILETFHITPKSWTADEFSVTSELTGCAVQFLRTLVTDCETGQIVAVSDSTLDGEPYTVSGEVRQCAATGGAGTPEPPEPCATNNVLQVCRCDDTDGDGISDTDYAELLAVDCDGVLTSIGAYLPDLSAPYVPVSPVACDPGSTGAEPALGVQAHRVELAVGQVWSAATYGPLLRSVTATAHTGPGQITTEDETSTLHQGETVTWSITKDTDTGLVGPLTITATGGVITVAYTLGVTL